MKPFKIYSTETATPPADKLLFAVQDMVGFVPNVFAVLAESEPSLRAFIDLNRQFSGTSFNAIEREIIQTATSAENLCTYCVAGHTAFAHMQDIDSRIINAVRNNEPVDDSKLESLNQFTREMVRSRGMVSQHQLDDFFNAGYTPAQAQEVILGICVKVFSNFSNNMIGIPLDDAFIPFAWDPDQAQVA
mgnify:CR=1 FL=1